MKKLILAISVIIISSCAAQLEGDKNLGKNNVAAKGYDVVSYFEESEPQEGNSTFSAVHDGGVYYFSNKENLNEFKKNPEKYTPQYGGFCAYGMAQNLKIDIDPTAWKIVDNKLYLNYTPNTHEIWLLDVDGNIKEANQNWSARKF